MKKLQTIYHMPALLCKRFCVNVPRLAHILCLLTLALGAVAPAWGADEETTALGLFGPTEETVSSARSPRPLSQIAENVSVITADQIALLNAHTLAEVLQTVPGIQLDQVRTPGSFTFFTINGAPSTQVQVLIDGVPQNDLIQNQPDVGLIPVQQIERVEIIKGAASAAWGSALGGVVNVVTKSPETEKAVSGAGFASAGERFTTDLHAEASGTVKRFGYYLSGGNLHSNGLLPGNRVNFNNTYGKLTYDLPGKGTITVGLDYRDAFRGLDESALYDFRDTDEIRFVNSFLSFVYPLSHKLGLELTARTTRRDDDGKLGFMSTSDLYKNFLVRQLTEGGGMKLSWGDNGASLVAGLEYEHDHIRQREPVNQFPLEQLDRNLDRWDTYLNGAFTLGDLTILPGLRFDHTGIGDDNLSYTLGATYRLTEKTVLRAYGARGYSLPNISFQNGLQKIWTVQAGAETGEIPYLWLKATYFYNDTWNIEEFDFTTDPVSVHLKEQIKQGYELEARTVALYGFSLTGGYTFTDARDHDTGERIQGVPLHGLKLALKYLNERLGLSGILTGNYVWWNMPADFNAHYKPVIWDLSLTKKLAPSRELSPEIFFTAHNLFDGSQYLNDVYKNTSRWLEGGVRFRF